MSQKPSFVAAAVVAALLVLGAGLTIGWFALQGNRPLLVNAVLDSDRITPNADGDSDATAVRYEITRNATVSIYFLTGDGERHYFRQERRRGTGQYQVLFSGVVDGYRLPDEITQGEILARLLQNGTYTWVIEARDDNGAVETASGPLTIADADGALPEMRNYTLDRTRFTPNQDGIDDRVEIQFDLQKEADVQVYLLRPDGVRDPIFEKELTVRPGEPGRHYFDYEGGVDNSETPPPDGTYPIIAFAQDAEGQKMQVVEEIEIQFGGVPRAYIISPAIGDTFEVNATSILLCDTLVFTVTVENDSTTPIRTTGPPPGTVYDSDWNYNTLGWETEAGAWRVAVGYENALSDYPFRWGLGDADSLEMIGDDTYLLPGERVSVSGGIRLIGPLGERNPQPVWAGLIHEDVRISQVNNRVDPKAILIEIPDPARIEPCAAREIPRRVENEN